MKEKKAIPQDDRFIIEVSESMEIRNYLRTGLLEAQNRDSDKIPLFVSWPIWLDDGIVCLYASDFRDILKSVIHETVMSVGAVAGDTALAKIPEKTGAAPFQSFDLASLEHIKSPQSKEGRKPK